MIILVIDALKTVNGLFTDIFCEFDLADIFLGKQKRMHELMTIFSLPSGPCTSHLPILALNKVIDMSVDQLHSLLFIDNQWHDDFIVFSKRTGKL